MTTAADVLDSEPTLSVTEQAKELATWVLRRVPALTADLDKCIQAGRYYDAAGTVNELAKLQARASALTNWANDTEHAAAAKPTATLEEAGLRVYLRMVRALRLDDQWSGRTNDARRCGFEGHVDALREIEELLRDGGTMKRLTVTPA